MLTPWTGCEAGTFSVFGELLSQPSRLAPNAAVDATVGQMMAIGLATSATVLCTSLLRSATKCAAVPERCSLVFATLARAWLYCPSRPTHISELWSNDQPVMHGG